MSEARPYVVRPTRESEDRRSRILVRILREARALIIDARRLSVEWPTNLLSIQRDIERALTEERRSRLRRHEVEKESDETGSENITTSTEPVATGNDEARAVESTIELDDRSQT
jgi:hypothetical protein